MSWHLAAHQSLYQDSLAVRKEKDCDNLYYTARNLFFLSKFVFYQDKYRNILETKINLKVKIAQYIKTSFQRIYL